PRDASRSRAQDSRQRRDRADGLFRLRAGSARNACRGGAGATEGVLRSYAAENSEPAGTRSRERAGTSAAALRNRGGIDLRGTRTDRASRRSQDRHDGCVLRDSAHPLGGGWKDLAAGGPPENAAPDIKFHAWRERAD